MYFWMCEWIGSWMDVQMTDCSMGWMAGQIDTMIDRLNNIQVMDELFGQMDRWWMDSGFVQGLKYMLMDGWLGRSYGWIEGRWINIFLYR